MPVRKPQPNYLPFFGPYKRDENFSHNIPSRLLLSPPKKSGALAKVLQTGLMSPVSAVNEDLSGAFPESNEGVRRLPNNFQPGKQQGPSMAGRVWDWANTGLISGDTIIGATSGVTREEIERAMDEVDPDQPYRQAARTFALGAYKDLADLASDFTSPISLALAGLGGVVKSGATATRKLAQTAQRLNRAQQVAVRTAPAAKSILAGAGAGFAGHGAHELASGRPLDTLVSTGKVLTGGQSDVSPEEARQTYANAAALSGGFGGAVSPFEFARVRLRDLQGELPARQRVSYTNFGDDQIPFEEANRLRSTKEFRSMVSDAEQKAPKYGQRVINSTTSVGKWEVIEPSATTEIWGKRKGGDPFAADVGKANNQKAVFRFREGLFGPDAEYTLVGLKDPVAALDLFKEYGLPGGRVENGNIIFAGEKKKFGRPINAVANDLGVSVNKKSGYAQVIPREKYDSILQDYQQQKELIAKNSSLNPLPISAVATSYAQQQKPGHKTKRKRF